jgi:hypothetical protein
VHDPSGKLIEAGVAVRAYIETSNRQVEIVLNPTASECVLGAIRECVAGDLASWPTAGEK